MKQTAKVTGEKMVKVFNLGPYLIYGDFRGIIYEVDFFKVWIIGLGYFYHAYLYLIDVDHMKIDIFQN